MLPELTSKRIVICTDREAAIENAIEKVLPTVPIVNCWNHLMQNVKHTVRGCGGTKEDVEVYQAHLNQLLSCISLTQYHTVKQDISSMWKNYHWIHQNILPSENTPTKLRRETALQPKGPTEEQLKVVVPAPDSKLGIQNQNILAFQVATRWAKKKFGRRLHPTTLDIAEKTFTPILTPRSTTSAVSTSKRFSALADTPPPPPTTWRTTVVPPQDQYQREWPALRQTYPPGSPALTRNAERKHYTTRGTGQAVGSQDTTGTGNLLHI
ncbi:hypothetical protein SKAU_G00410550 [Synaphobranchus kaupii]|uniref:MULE transposase domain-containing protein n=1 Tax=Synaphobranchus kaupii TaxID=118154 RepID=A0A9Q1IBQ1_SYNKA|nr:hypothetical protein SKAU_G00410550 [Synaphobranchus kaupii]